MAGRSHDPSSASKFVAVTPSDATLLAATRGVYVGVAGDIYIDGALQGTNVLMKAAGIGEHPWQVTRIYSTGTTATNIVALY